MATNEFLPFATAGGANVLSQAEWLALAARLAGYTSGVANSAQINKGLRQTASMTAMLGQFIADVGGLDALDDSDIGKLLDHFVATYRSQKPNYVVAGGSANALTVTLDPPLDAYRIGMVLRVRLASAPTGAMTINADSLGAIPVTRANGAPIRDGDLSAGQVVSLVCQGTSWQAVALSPSSLINTMKSVLVPSAVAFAASGTWTKPANLLYIDVRMLGAGGGGAMAGSSTPAQVYGGGGGNGGWVRSIITADALPATVAVTIGAGGLGYPVSSGGWGPGTDGGDSRFGSFLRAGGGKGAAWQTIIDNFGYGGAGGTFDPALEVVAGASGYNGNVGNGMTVPTQIGVGGQGGIGGTRTTGGPVVGASNGNPGNVYILQYTLGA